MIWDRVEGVYIDDMALYVNHKGEYKLEEQIILRYPTKEELKEIKHKLGDRYVEKTHK
jgi:hypothetical protein